MTDHNQEVAPSGTGPPPAVRVENLTKRFGSFSAVSDVSFEAREGKITALLGPSGSGKSTVLRILAGLEHADAGRVWIMGEQLDNRSVQERQLGFVFQHYALFRHMTVRQNIAFGLAVRRESKANQTKRVDELVSLVQLKGLEDRWPDQLSGGQRQRVALARALAPRPKLLLLDEPFGALDARVRQELRKWLDQLHRELGITSLLVTHDQEEALELAHEVIVMNRGMVEQIGTSTEVYNTPATPFVAGFVGAANVIQGVAINGRVQFGEQFLGGAQHLEDGSPAHAYVRPHDVWVGRESRNGSSSPGRIERAADLGWVTKLHVRLPDDQLVIADVPNDKLQGLQAGDSVFVDLRRAKVFEPPGAARSDELSVA
ncbi:MAG: sulfate/molybdate ABC transporter ATP-binding protein [Actinomycetota bacterium]|nr:sulfate/molybdate ABC transporter ATP-binding protein [Actinomycetota bacterium]